MIVRSAFFLVCLFFYVRGQYDPMNAPVPIVPETRLSEELYTLQNFTPRTFIALKPSLSRNFRTNEDSLLTFKHWPLYKNFFLSKSFNNWDRAKNKYHFLLHPVWTTEAGADFLERRMCHQLSGGVRLRLNVNDDFSFQGEAEGGELSFPFFMDSVVREQNKISSGPGILYSKYNSLSYNFFQYSFRAVYSPRTNPYFTIHIGKDRFFVGEGIRSLLHSSTANPYWFAMMQWNIWQIQYNIWYALMDDYPVTHPVFQSEIKRKYGVFHHIQWNIYKGLSFGILENVIWKGSDSLHYRGFDPNYLSPFVFFRPQEYALGSSDNSFLGAHLTWRFLKQYKLYSQIALDEFFLKEIRARRGWWANKQGWQFGLLVFKPFGIKNVVFSAEYNEVRPYTYSHAHPSQSYSHAGLPLAHPWGANFKEYLSSLDFRYKNWWCGMKAIYGISGKDSVRNTGPNWGGNIFLSYMTHPKEYGNITTQGVIQYWFQFHTWVRYFIIPKMNLYAEAGFVQRNIRQENGYILQNPYVYFRLSTSFLYIFNEL